MLRLADGEIFATGVCRYEDQPWMHPSILGLSGCLEALRFAVDPKTNLFYFGPLPA
jgi:hypothetical protein